MPHNLYGNTMFVNTIMHLLIEKQYIQLLKLMWHQAHCTGRSTSKRQLNQSTIVILHKENAKNKIKLSSFTPLLVKFFQPVEVMSPN